MKQIQIHRLTSHNIKTTCLILCRPPLCCQNSSEASRHGLHKTTERVLWYLAPRHQQQILVSPASCVVEPRGSWIRFVGPAQPIDGLRSGGIWRPRQHPELFVMFLKPFLNKLCSVAGCIILLKEAIPSGNTIAIEECTWSATVFR